MKKITKVFAVLTCAALAFSFWSCDNGNKVETYTVTYEDGVDDAEIAVPSDSTKYITGDTVTVKFEGIGSRDGYTFAGWKDGTTTYTESGTSTFKMKAADVTLTASWTEKTANTDSSDKRPTSSENGHLTFTNLKLNEVSGASVENKTVTFTQWGTVYWKYDGIDSYDKIRFTVSSDDASADTDDIKLNLLLGGYNSSSGDLANNEDLIWIDIRRDDKGKALEKTFSIAIDEIKQRVSDAANIPLASVSFDSIVIKN